MNDGRILCIGLVTVDIVQVCSTFPLEDSDQRCLDSYWQRGGNASNNCTVLAQLGAKNEFFGTISGGMFCEYIKNDFKAQNIIIGNCIYYNECDSPISFVILNSKTGSRTIVHSNKNLPELSVENFKNLDLSSYTWIHFEGRNVEQIRLMLEHALNWRTKNAAQFKISVELEKPRSEQNVLCAFADILFIGKDYAKFRGFNSMKETINNIKSAAKPGAILISAWGEDGATGFSDVDGYVFSSAYLQPSTVDTLGAGDTFCAAVIFSLNKGHDLKSSIKFGCQVAGAKVGLSGMTSLNKVVDVFIKELQSNK